MQYRFLRELVARAQEPLRRRRRRSEHLPLARRRRPQHPRTFAATTPTPRSSSSSRTTARPSASSPRRSASSRGRTSASRRSCGPRTTPGELVHVVAARDERDEAAFVVRGRSGALAPKARLSAKIAVFYRDPRPVARARRGDAGRQPSVPDHRRHEVLRARRDQGRRSRTCASCVNPRSDVDLAARHQRAGARHRADDGRPADRVGDASRTRRSSTRSRTSTRSETSAPPRRRSSWGSASSS